MTWKPEEIEALAAGELAEEHHARVLEALAADPAAAAELEQCLQLRAAAHEIAAEPANLAAAAAKADPASLDAARERKPRVVGAGSRLPCRSSLPLPRS